MDEVVMAIEELTRAVEKSNDLLEDIKNSLNTSYPLSMANIISDMKSSLDAIEIYIASK